MTKISLNVYSIKPFKKHETFDKVICIKKTGQSNELYLLFCLIVTADKSLHAGMFNINIHMRGICNVTAMAYFHL
jgi:hypothetical protein